MHDAATSCTTPCAAPHVHLHITAGHYRWCCSAQVWDLAKRSRTAAHTLASPVPGPQRFRAARFAFCRDGSDSARQAGAAHMAVYWAAAEASQGDADTGYVAVYQLSTEAAGATQFDPALLAALPVSN